MTTFHTLNPVGSAAAKDRYDNTENLDLLALGPLEAYPDRLDQPRKSWRGFENEHNRDQIRREAEFDADQTRRESEFDADQAERASEFDADQAQRIDMFNQFLVNSGYEDIGAYDSGPLTIETRNQIFEKSGELWRAAADLVMPYTTVNNWAADQSKFVSVGDASLRQEIGGLYTKTVSFWKYGGVGIGGDDTLAIAACIAAVKADRSLRLVQNGGFWKTSQTLNLTVPGDFAIVGQEPRHWEFNCTIQYTGPDKAIDIRGNGFAHSVRVDTLIGPGVTTLGTPGGTDENIGLHIGPNSGVRADIGTVRGFNHNLMIDGGYFNRINFGYSFDCYAAITLRRNPNPATNFRADGNIITGNVAGGPYTDVNAADFATRRLSTAVYGLYADGASDNQVNIGAFEYCVRTDNGRGVYLGADTQYNKVYGHVEGGITGLVEDYGSYNTLPAYNSNSVRMTGFALRSAGFMPRIGPLGSQGVATQDALFAPHGGQSGMSIPPHAIIEGPRIQQEQRASLLSAYSIVSADPGDAAFSPSNVGASPITVTRSSGGLPPAANWPSSFGKYQMVTTVASNRWVTVGPHTTPAGDLDMMMSCFIRGVTGRLKVSIFILDQTLTLIPDAKFNTELSSSQTDWQEVKFPIKKGSATGVYYRISIRDMSGGTGGSIEFANPNITDNVASAINATVLAGTKDKIAIKGSALCQPINQNYAMIYPDVSLSISATGIDVRGRPLVRVTSVASGDTINGFRSVTPGQTFDLLNRSGANIVIAGSAIANSIAFNIADKQSRRFFCDPSDSLIYVLS